MPALFGQRYPAGGAIQQADAYDHKQRGHGVAVIFLGAGTRWLRELGKPENPGHGLFEAVQDTVVGASCGCADVFGAADGVKASGFDVLDENKVPGTSGLPSVCQLVFRLWKLRYGLARTVAQCVASAGTKGRGTIGCRRGASSLSRCGVTRCFFLYAPRRVECPSCGIRVKRMPWVVGKHRLTEAYAWFLAGWAKRLSWKEVAKALIVEHCVEPAAINLDEVFQKAE